MSPLEVQLCVENGDTPLQALRIHAELSPHFALLLADYCRAIERLPESISLWILSNPRDKTIIGELLTREASHRSKQRIRVINTEHDASISLWAQDDAKPLSNGRAMLSPKSYLAHRPGSLQEDARRSALNTLAAESLHALRAPFSFDGGDIVVGARHIFISEAIRESAPREDIARYLVKPCIEVERLDFHLDLTMAIVRDHTTGAEAVLLSSATEAARCCDEEPASVATKDTLLGRAISRCPPIPTLREATHREERLLLLKERLSVLGYRVLWVPGVVFDDESRGARPWLGHRLSRINYTNALCIERYALIPGFALPSFDRAAVSVYRSLGYEVILMPSARYLFCLDGGVRCATGLIPATAIERAGTGGTP